MNYIYDIVLNFHDNYYNFFEWNRNDKIKNIYKVSVYRVKDKDILNLKYNKIKIPENLINKIKEDNPKHKKLICLVSNTKTSIGLLFDKEGNLKKRSSLLFEEEKEVNNLAKNLSILNIKYTENKKEEIKNTLRIEKEKKQIIINYIKKTQNNSALKYLYYEYYNKECNDIKIIKKSLLEELKKEWNTKQNKIYNLIAILTKKQTTFLT